MTASGIILVGAAYDSSVILPRVRDPRFIAIRRGGTLTKSFVLLNRSAPLATSGRLDGTRGRRQLA